MKVTVNINGVEYEYNAADKNLKKNEWLKCVDGEWQIINIGESNIEKEDYDE